MLRNIFSYLLVLSLVLCLCILKSPFAAAACSEENLVTNLNNGYMLRKMLFIAQTGDVRAMQEATQARRGHLEELFDELEATPESTPARQKVLDEICQEIDVIFAIVDNMLAGGGDGDWKSKKLKTPWKQRAPEDLVDCQMRLDEICEDDFSDKCNSEEYTTMLYSSEALKNDLESGKLSASDFVDASYALCEKRLIFLRE